jgi:hypothetical protein
LFFRAAYRCPSMNTFELSTSIRHSSTRTPPESYKASKPNRLQSFFVSLNRHVYFSVSQNRQ